MSDDRSIDAQNSTIHVANTGDNATIHYHSSPQAASPILSPAANSQAAHLFIGRENELNALKIALDKQQTVTITAVLEGMAGVGKSYLVDHFALKAEPPYRYEILSLNPSAQETVAGLIAQLAERFKISPHVGEICEFFKINNVLLHIENVDTPELAVIAIGLVQQLQGCRLVLSGRVHDLGRGSGFKCIQLQPFSIVEGIKQLEQELIALEAAPLAADELEKIVKALAGLPLAIHLAAGYLATGYNSVDEFLNELHSSQLKLESEFYADKGGRNAPRCTLHAAFNISLHAFARTLPAHATLIHALGFSYSRDIGFTLAKDLLACSESDAKKILKQASRLGLIIEELAAEFVHSRWQIHPLIAEYLRAEATDSAAIEQRLTDWFMQRLPEPKPSKPKLYNWFQKLIAWLMRRKLYVAPHFYNEKNPYQAWHELNSEQEAMRTWLERVPLEQGEAIERAGSRYAIHNGSWTSWRQFCEKLLASALSDEARSHVLWTACRCSANLGDLDQAYQFAEQKTWLDQRLGNELEYAQAREQIADILETRGEFDEALRILKEELMPIFEHLNDIRERAVCFGRVADILYQLGKFDESLQIRQQKQIPIYKHLDDMHSWAVTIRKIADIFQAKDQLDKALGLLKEDALPIVQKLGAVRDIAVFQGRIADILYWQGQLDEALRIRQQEEMPVYEYLGDVRELLVVQTKTAIVLMELSEPRPAEAHQLLCQAFQAARKMRIPEAGHIEKILQRFGMKCQH